MRVRRRLAQPVRFHHAQVVHDGLRRRGRAGGCGGPYAPAGGPGWGGTAPPGTAPYVPPVVPYVPPYAAPLWGTGPYGEGAPGPTGYAGGTRPPKTRHTYGATSTPPNVHSRPRPSISGTFVPALTWSSTPVRAVSPPVRAPLTAARITSRPVNSAATANCSGRPRVRRTASTPISSAQPSPPATVPVTDQPPHTWSRSPRPKDTWCSLLVP